LSDVEVVSERLLNNETIQVYSQSK